MSINYVSEFLESSMDHNGRGEAYPLENACGSEKSQLDSNEEDIPWNSDDETSQSNSGEYSDANPLPEDFETVSHDAYRGLISNEEFTLFIRTFLRRSVNVNQINSLRQTALMVACKTGNAVAVREILKWRDDDGERADISAQDFDGKTAIVIARQANNTEIVTMLEQNAFLRAVEMDDTVFVEFYLPAKLERGDTETLKICPPVKESKFQIVYSRTSDTKIHPADKYEHNSELMEGLPSDDDSTEEPSPKRSKVEIEAHFSKKDVITQSIWLEAVTIACRKSHYKMLSLLFSDGRLCQGSNGIWQTLLQKAVGKYLAVEYDLARLSVIEYLLMSWKLRSDTSNLETESILNFVCKVNPQNKRHENIQINQLLKVLLQCGIDLNGRNKNRETFLMLACENGRIDIVCSLLNSTLPGFFPDIDAVDNSGKNALMKAKQNRSSEILAALLKFKKFNFELMSAIENGNESIVKSVLNVIVTSDVFLKSYNLKQEQDYRKTENTDKFNAWKGAMYVAMEKYAKYEKKLKYLLDPDILSSLEAIIGVPILHRLVNQRENEEDDDADKKRRLIEMLLKSGQINVNARNTDGYTALHLVNGEKLASLLIRYGADVNKKDNIGETPLVYLSDFSHKDSVFREILKKEGAAVVDLDAMDCNGRTALMIAAVKGRPDVVELLLNAGASVNISDELGNGNESIVDTADVFLKSWNSKQEQDYRKTENTDKFNAWKGAMYVAMEKYAIYEQILKYLLDPDILSSLESIIRDPILHRLVHQKYQKVNAKKVDAEEVDAEEKQRLIEMLLKSGKINVNARDTDGYTALHLVNGEELASLLIHYGADVNKKENKGRTPLMISSKYSHKDSVFRTILKKEGVAVVDLDAMDCNGRTALMIAAMESRPNAVDLLLKAGASVNISDQLGFTVLHHALYDELIEFDEFPRNFKELKKRNEIVTILFDAKEPHERGCWFRKNKEWNEERMKIVEMLLQRQDIDVNALSFEKFSPLDITEGWIPQYRPSIQNALKEKGAVLKVFQQAESQSTSDFYLDVRCRLTLQRLINLPLTRDAKYFDTLEDRLVTLIEKFKNKIASGKDQQERTALHLVAISISMISVVNRSYEDGSDDKDDDDDGEDDDGEDDDGEDDDGEDDDGEDDDGEDDDGEDDDGEDDDGEDDDGEDDESKESRLAKKIGKKIVSKLIELDCIVNETDVYGRTPLHYADDVLQGLLESKGADASIKDKDGNSAIDETSRSNDDRRSIFSSNHWVEALNKIINKTPVFNLMNKNKVEISVENSDSSDTMSIPKLLWEECESASKHRLFQKITEDVTVLVKKIADEIKTLDERFEIDIEFVGSSYEGTRLKQPDEFDFCFVLKKFSELCEVSHSPELPTGFVRLKRKSIKEGENDFDSFFGKDGILNTEKLNWHFGTILRNALVNIESRQSYDWNLELQRAKISKWFQYNKFTSSSYRIEKVVNFNMIKPLNSASVNIISVDIVPCIHIDGWWPDAAISNVSKKIKTRGCNLVLDRPHDLYPWVPYSESCARISFSKAESDTIEQICDNAKEAYMIGKTMIKEYKNELNSSYILKNSLLYCIEALTPTSEKDSKLGLSLENTKSKLDEIDRQVWLRCLMKCHLDFIAQDFCPCYFLPNLSSPIGKEHVPSEESLKHCSLSWMTDGNQRYPLKCIIAFAFYRCTSNDSTETGLQLPVPDPLWERFDRDKLIASLREIAYK